MRTAKTRLMLLPTCLVGWTLVGCGEATDPPGAASNAAPPSAAATQKPTVAKSETPSVVPPKTPVAKSEPAEPKPQVVKSDGYVPPFPDRIDMFLAPKRAGTTADAAATSTAPDVALLGFANVSEPLAILAVNGIVLPLAEGATGEGVEVISIQPPTVVLQRDRQRWQATLKN